jgi:hypothetical protein
VTDISIATTFHVIACPNCAALFAIPDEAHDAYRRTGNDFCCPNRHTMSYRDSTEAKLRQTKDALARERADNDQLRAAREAAERRASAAKGQVTKIKNRVGRGVCPCCNRTFADLTRHMATKHPDFVPQVKKDAQGLTG